MIDRIMLLQSYAEISDEKAIREKGLYLGDSFDGPIYTFSDRYYKLYFAYRRLLDQYLLDIFSLKEFDDRIFESGLRFIPLQRGDMDFYQYLSNMDLKYFYLRNNLYLEHLSMEDAEYVLGLSDEELLNPVEKTRDLIERTYPDVIDYAFGKGLPGISLYGPDSPRFWIDSSELVFGFIFDEVAENGLGHNDVWFENNIKQRMFLKTTFDEMIQKALQITEKTINILWYNEFTVRESIAGWSERMSTT